MEPFVYMGEYSLLVCTGCQFTTLGNEVPTHLRTRHRDVGLERRGQIIEAIRQIPRPQLLHKQADLASLRRPGPESPAIAQLAAPRADGLGCRQCPYVVRQVQTMQDHCRAEHSWQNERARGGDIRQKASVERALPWREGVRCQRWFSSRAGSHWFEKVQRSPRLRPAACPQARAQIPRGPIQGQMPALLPGPDAAAGQPTGRGSDGRPGRRMVFGEHLAKDRPI